LHAEGNGPSMTSLNTGASTASFSQGEHGAHRTFSASSAPSAVNAVDEDAESRNDGVNAVTEHSAATNATGSDSVSSVSSVVEKRPVLRIGWRHIRGLGEKTRQALQRAHQDGAFERSEEHTSELQSRE